MKYSFALDQNGGIVNINDYSLDKNDRFFCCSCKKEMVLKKGEIRVHHFAHKSSDPCNYETYIHKLAKQMFFNKYNECLKNRIPFYLEYPLSIYCSGCNNTLLESSRCKINDTTERYDLTSFFDQISIEKRHNGFVPDILLSSSKSNLVMYIEIANTHECDQNKIDSGTRIVEYFIDEEEDLVSLFTNEILLDNEKIRRFNFKPSSKDEALNYINTCPKNREVFVVYKSNKSILLTKDQFLNLNQSILRKIRYYHRTAENECIDGFGMLFVVNVILYSFENSDFKSCLICKHINPSPDFKIGKTITCTRKAMGVSQEEALYCSSFVKSDRAILDKILSKYRN